MSCYAQLLNKVSKYPLLKEEETNLLIKQFNNGDMEAKQKLVNHNLLLVINVARKFEKFDEDKLCDLIQDGTLGLIRAIEKFNPEKKVLFSTYAYRWIQSKIGDSFASSVQSSYVPNHIKRAARKIENIEKNLIEANATGNILKLTLEAFNATSDKELSEFEFMEIRALNKSSISTNYQLADDSSSTIQDTLESDENLENIVTMNQLNNWIQLKVNELPENQRTALSSYFGINGKTAIKLREIGKEMGCTGSRAQQLVQEGLKKLRVVAAKDNINLAF